MKKSALEQASNHRAPAELALRLAGLRVTKARLAVLSSLLASHSPMPHHALHALLPELDRVTLYRTLDSLIEAGLAQKIADDERAFRYCATPADEGNDAHARHGHFKCAGCGRVFCLSLAPKKRSLMDKIQQSLQHAVGPGFQTHSIELTIKGWCADCSS